MALIECNRLTLGYDSKEVVKNLTFKVEVGDYLCILGDNGSGKSTLMKTILRLQKPLSGTIFVGDGLCRHEIGYLPQQTDIQKDFPASVFEVVLSGCLPRLGRAFFYGRAERERAKKAMSDLGISHLMKKSYRELSGGQQQRVLLARALCATDKLIFLDEPVSGLDVHAASEMYALLETLNKEKKVAVIMISHDVAAALKYANKILHISEKPEFFESREEFINSETGRGYLPELSKGQVGV